MARVMAATGDGGELADVSAAALQTLHGLMALDDEWIVYVRPSIGADRPAFVAAHPAFGVCVIVVENWAVGEHRQSTDGRVEQRTTAADGQGGWAPIEEYPRDTAARIRQAVVDLIDTERRPDPGLVRAIVVLPHYTTAQACSLLRRPQMIGHDTWIKVWGGQALFDDAACVVTGHPRPTPRSVPAASLDALHRHCIRDAAARAEVSRA